MESEIPIFSGVNMSKGGLISLSTCGQFLSFIEHHARKFNLTELELKNLCQSKISDKALQFFQSNSDKPWDELKHLMIEEFSVKLNIREKVEVRKKLNQKDNETINNFYTRCVVAQFLVSDDIRDVAFEREVLLHFLIGLQPTIRDMVLATKCSSPEEYIQKATFFHNTVSNPIKEEPLEDEVDVKIEADPPAFDDYDYYDVEQKPLTDYGDYADESVIDDEQPEKTESKWKCELCGKSLKSKHNLSLHHQLCLSQRNCKYCEEICDNKVHLKAHMRTDHPDILRKSGWGKCKICSEIFKSKKLKDEHMDKVHGHLKATCEICKEVCASTKLLANHLAKKHCQIIEENEKESLTKVSCLYCNKCTNTIGHVKYHILSIHFNQPNFKCNYCEKGFEGQISLDNHVRTHHLMERTYQCDKCPMDFKTKSGLNHHITAQHTEHKVLQCDHCDKTFKNKLALNGHVHYVHKAENDRVVCSDCGKSFKKRQTYKLHYIREHSSPEELEKHKVYCQFPGCKYSAMAAAKVKWHFDKVHLKMKDFPCKFCSRNCDGKQALEEHINAVHLNIKPHKCDLCDFASAFKSKVRVHKKAVHGEKAQRSAGRQFCLI